MRKLFLILSLCSLTYTSWSYFALQQTVHRLRAAAITSDSASLRTLADLPAMRAELTAELDSALVEQQQSDHVPDADFLPFKAQADRRVVELTSPTGFLFILQHGATHEPPGGHTPSHDGMNVATSLKLGGLNLVYLALKSPDAAPGDSVLIGLERRGVTWTAVRMFTPGILLP